MKKSFIIIIFATLFFPSLISAKVLMDYNEAVKNKEAYIQTLDNQKYIFTNSNNYFFNSGTNTSLSGYTSGGFISLEEYNISGGFNSYLMDGQTYWSMSNNNGKVYVISKDVSAEDINSKHGVRVTKYLGTNSIVTVSGAGTYINPWELKVEIDKQAPIISDVSTQTKKQYINNYNVTLKVEDRGRSSLNSNNQYQYYLSSSNKSLTGGAWKNYNSGTPFNIGAGLSGTYYLFVKRVSDNFDNLSSSSNLDNLLGYHIFGPYLFDNQKPTCSIAKNIYTYSQSLVLTVTGSDNLKLKSIPYSWTSPSSTSSQVTITGNGTYSVRITDETGNTNSCSIAISNIDRISPTCRLTYSQYSYSSTIYLSGSDDKKLAVYPYSWNNSSYTTSSTRSVSSAGTYYGYIKDEAGNIGVCSSYVSIYIPDPPSPPSPPYCYSCCTCKPWIVPWRR